MARTAPLGAKPSSSPAVVGDRQWRLKGCCGDAGPRPPRHHAGGGCVLLDGTLAALDGTAISQNPAAAIVAIGTGDSDPASANCRGLTQRPLFQCIPLPSPTGRHACAALDARARHGHN
jgi:hypothetical protein